MRRLPHAVAALLLAAVSLPAQWSIEARIGRHVGAAVRLADCLDRHRPACPPPRPVFDDCHERRHGHWQTVTEQYLVPGYWRDEHVPPTYGWICEPCGHRRWGMIDPGGCRRVWTPDRWETRTRQVWVRC